MTSANLHLRMNSTREVKKTMTSGQTEKQTDEYKHVHEHDHYHDHSHSHSIFGGHSHDHDHGAEGAKSLVAAMQGKGDRGSRITLIGLASNIGLTAAKGTAGIYMHSASLLAEAGHSLSDLVGDFVTLFCWRLSRKPPTERYPYGLAKFETLGTTTVSLILVGGALAIGLHSYHLLIDALHHTVSTLPAGPAQDLLQNVTSTAHAIPVPTVGHSHAYATDLDPNAAWFAAISVVTKEWLYRITKKVADEERSPVLAANAMHHRSDAYSSAVVVFAILGSSFFPAIPLDPLGGLFVAILILRQSWGGLIGALGDLTDASVPRRTRNAYLRALEPLVSSSPSSDSNTYPSPSSSLLGLHSVKAKRAGSHVTVDLVASVPSSLSVGETAGLEEKISRTLKQARKEINNVRIRFEPAVEKKESAS